jgi:transketolase
MGWERYVGNSENIIGIDRFGASAPGGTVMEKFGFSVENIVKRAILISEK